MIYRIEKKVIFILSKY